MPSTKLVALVTLAVQASLQMLTMRYSRLPSQPRYSAASAVVTSEVLKILASAVLLYVEQLRGGERAVDQLWRDIFIDWRGAGRAAGAARPEPLGLTRPFPTQARSRSAHQRWSTSCRTTCCTLRHRILRLPYARSASQSDSRPQIQPWEPLS